MLTCVRYNLILLKFDIVKLLLCNTNTTTNANEFKALTRVESEVLITSPRLLHKLKLLQKTVKQANPNEHYQRVHTNLEIILGRLEMQA